MSAEFRLSDERKVALTDAVANFDLGDWHEGYLWHLVESIVASEREAARAEAERWKVIAQEMDALACERLTRAETVDAAERALVERIEAEMQTQGVAPSDTGPTVGWIAVRNAVEVVRRTALTRPDTELQANSQQHQDLKFSADTGATR